MKMILTTQTGHTCRCKDGFTGIPTDKQYGCQNINECINGSNDCHEKAFCTDLTPGYKCKCKPGYTGNGVTCKDVDECSPLSGSNKCDKGANSQCVNTPGSFECVCKDGYVSTSFEQGYLNSTETRYRFRTHSSQYDTIFEIDQQLNI